MQKFETLISEMVTACAKMHTATFIYFDILSSNGIIAKIVLCDLDLLFEGHKFETVIPLK